MQAIKSLLSPLTGNSNPIQDTLVSYSYSPPFARAETRVARRLQKLVVIGGTVETARRASVSAWNGFIDCELPPWDPDRTPDSVIYIYRRRQPSSSPHISVKKTTRMIGASELPISVCSTTTTAPPTRQLPHSFLVFHLCAFEFALVIRTRCCGSVENCLTDALHLCQVDALALQGAYPVNTYLYIPLHRPSPIRPLAGEESFKLRRIPQYSNLRGAGAASSTSRRAP